MKEITRKFLIDFMILILITLSIIGIVYYAVFLPVSTEKVSFTTKFADSHGNILTMDNQIYKVDFPYTPSVIYESDYSFVSQYGWDFTCDKTDYHFADSRISNCTTFYRAMNYGLSKQDNIQTIGNVNLGV
jgi:hypothetical protein